MQEKLGAQNVATRKTQGKQHKSNDHWKSIKTFVWKKITGMTQRRQK